jgi:hypothetical protein
VDRREPIRPPQSQRRPKGRDYQERGQAAGRDRGGCATFGGGQSIGLARSKDTNGGDTVSPPLAEEWKPSKNHNTTLAKEHHIPERKLRQAGKVLDKAPELAAKVRVGEMPLAKAVHAVRVDKPKDQPAQVQSILPGLSPNKDQRKLAVRMLRAARDMGKRTSSLGNGNPEKVESYALGCKDPCELEEMIRRLRSVKHILERTLPILDALLAVSPTEKQVADKWARLREEETRNQ